MRSRRRNREEKRVKVGVTVMAVAPFDLEDGRSMGLRNDSNIAPPYPLTNHELNYHQLSIVKAE
jgi:hypothetical protein